MRRPRLTPDATDTVVLVALLATLVGAALVAAAVATNNEGWAVGATGPALTAVVMWSVAFLAG